MFGEFSMLRAAIGFLLVFVTGCAYSYRMNVDEAIPTSKTAEITFSNVIKMAEIDGEEFKPKFSIWVHGSHTVTLQPGKHTFRFRYDAVSQRGGYYTPGYTTLTRELEPDKRYELTSKISKGRIHFSIIELKKSEGNNSSGQSTTDSCADGGTPSNCSQDANVRH